MIDLYKAPTDKIFNEIKEKSIEIWNQYDNTYGYVDEKLRIVNTTTNIKDNYLYIFNMFDMSNQRKLLKMLSPKSRKYILNRLLSIYRIWLMME